MIYQFSHPSAQTSSQPVEGIHAAPGINPYKRRGIPAAFRTPNDGSRPDDKEGKEERKPVEHEDQWEVAPEIPEIFQLLIDTDYQEMFDFFMIPTQRAVLKLRLSIRGQKNLSEQLLFRSEIMPRGKIDNVRQQLYLVTYRYYYSPAGNQFFAIG